MKQILPLYLLINQCLDNTVVTNIGGFAGRSDLSDFRFKLNIKEDIPSIGFIKKLRPVVYELDMKTLAGFA